jgi:uncharacterized repeat protein (TIGR03803 family)
VSITANRAALGVCAASILFAGCGGSQLPIGAPVAMQQSHALPSSYRVLFDFRDRNGAYPYADLLNVNGTLYGTTAAGGVNGDGTVFSVTTTGDEKVLYSFGGGSDGAQPFAGLIDVKGTLYGTTDKGGTNGYGTVFSVTTTGDEKPLYSFGGGSDGAYPYAGLMNVNGTLYGTSLHGGSRGCLDHSLAAEPVLRSSRSER